MSNGRRREQQQSDRSQGVRLHFERLGDQDDVGLILHLNTARAHQDLVVLAEGRHAGQLLFRSLSGRRPQRGDRLAA